MVAYTGIQGQNILIVSSDPSNPVEGQIWYNSTSNLLKGYAVGVASWATGGNLPIGTTQLGGAGTQTAALAFGGNTPASVTVATSLKYDGTAWTATGSLNTARRGGIGGAGIQTSALAFGGKTPSVTTATEEWTGTPSTGTASTLTTS